MKCRGVDIKFDWIRSFEQFQKLQEFAKTFDHEIPTAAHELVAVRVGDQWIGYAQMFGPLAMTAWHPIHSTPRLVLEANKAFIGHAKLRYGFGFVTVPTDTKTFLPDVMEKLGFERMGLELYEISGS